MGKGKGRQAGYFGSKSQSAAFAQEMRHETRQIQLSRPKSQPQNPKRHERPRLASLTQLRGILQERQSQEAHLLMERRRRAGFLPRRTEENNAVPRTKQSVSHPPGWMIEYECNVESLQSKCVVVMGQYILEYLEALGKEELRALLSLLPSETLANLSVEVSKIKGINNDLAVVLGKHAHCEALCFRATQDEETLNDEGIRELIPHLPSQGVQDSWEDFDGTDDALVDVMHLEGCNVRLKRLELLDCRSISADVLIELLEKCACITHLSLAGSLNGVEDGIKILRAIPNLLPALRVLDLTKCSWMTTSLLGSFAQCYQSFPNSPPTVHSQGCFTGSYEVFDREEW